MIAAALFASATVALSLPAEHRLIEGVASDGETVWVSSVVDRQILTWRDGRWIATQLPDAASRPLGLAWDARRRWLWIAADCPAIGRSDPCVGSKLVAVDMNGRVRKLLACTDEVHFGDVSVSGRRVLVSDGASGAVYQWSGGLDLLRPLLGKDAGVSAQGTATWHGRRYVADYGRGLSLIGTNRKPSPLLVDGKPVRGVDGLIRTGAWLVGVQNGAQPARVLAWRLAPGGVGRQRVLWTAPAGAEPTQVTVWRGRLLIAADAQWAAYTGAAAARLPQHATPLLSLPLPR